MQYIQGRISSTIQSIVNCQHLFMFFKNQIIKTLGSILLLLLLLLDYNVQTAREYNIHDVISVY